MNLSIDGTTLEQLSIKQSSEVAKFDFMLRFVYNPTLDDNKLSFHLCSSRDLFNEMTIAVIGQRFKHLFEQLFLSNSGFSRIDTSNTPISKLDLILPEEVRNIEGVIFCRQLDIVNEGMCIDFKIVLCLTPISDLSAI